MSASESRQDDALDAARKKRANADRLSLAALRSQFTSTPKVSTDLAKPANLKHHQSNEKSNGSKPSKQLWDRSGNQE